MLVSLHCGTKDITKMVAGRQELSWCHWMEVWSFTESPPGKVHCSLKERTSIALDGIRKNHFMVANWWLYMVFIYIHLIGMLKMIQVSYGLSSELTKDWRMLLRHIALSDIYLNYILWNLLAMNFILRNYLSLELMSKANYISTAAHLSSVELRDSFYTQNMYWHTNTVHPGRTLHNQNFWLFCDVDNYKSSKVIYRSRFRTIEIGFYGCPGLEKCQLHIGWACLVHHQDLHLWVVLGHLPKNPWAELCPYLEVQLGLRPPKATS